MPSLTKTTTFGRLPSMKKILLLLSLMSLAAVLAVAQDTPGSSSPQSSTPSPSTSATPSDQSGSTMRGCLGGMTGNYTLTDDRTGTVYNLTGNTDNLSSKVGHEVEVSGQLASSASSTSSASSPAPAIRAALVRPPAQAPPPLLTRMPRTLFR